MRVLALVLAFLLCSCPIWAQAGTEGSILGIVKDSSGAVLPNANIVVANLETGLSKTATTDGNGFFQVLALPRGVYSVTVSMPHFSTWQLSSTELTAGEEKRVQPTLT